MTVLLATGVALAWPLEERFLDRRYVADGLEGDGVNAYFRDVSDERIAVFGTATYPLFGLDLSNEPEIVELPLDTPGGTERCRRTMSLLQDGYRYVVLTPLEGFIAVVRPDERWFTSDSTFTELVRDGRTVLYRMDGRPDPGPVRLMDGSPRRLWVVSPSYRDVPSFLMLREQVLEAAAGAPGMGNTPASFVVVDDTAGRDPEVEALRCLPDTRVVEPPFNLGHQRAIVFALRKLGPCLADDDAVVTIDSDGEDRPEDLPRLLAALVAPGASEHRSCWPGERVARSPWPSRSATSSSGSCSGRSQAP